MILAKKKKAAKGDAAEGMQLRHYDVIKSPVITEKSTKLSEQGKFVFNIAPRASKSDVKAAVEAIFGVKVKSVNTLNRLGKIKNSRGNVGKRSDTKKAIVTLVEGSSIDLAAGAK